MMIEKPGKRRRGAAPHDPARAMRERLLRLERQEKARAEAQAVSQGVDETVELSRARGAAIDKAVAERGARETPYRRMTGLQWLARKGRLSKAQLEAGERYGASYRRAGRTASLGSTLDVQPGMSAPGGPSLDAILRKASGRQQAQARLDGMRDRLMRQRDLVAACDQVCGEELTPREAAGGDRDAARLEAVLKVALDLLALP